MSIARFLGVLAPAVAILPLLAQAPPAPPPFVRLHLTALDAQGRPVGDLKPGDLQVQDQGKAQHIVYFHSDAAPAAAPAGALSNRSGAPPLTVAILFDLMNQPKPEAMDAWKKLRLSLEQLSSGESIYFYVLGVDGSLVPVHGIPENAYVASGDDRSWPKKLDGENKNILKMIGRTRPAGMLQEDAVKKTYVALETVGKQLADFSGERHLLWVMRDVPTVSNPKTPCNGDWLDCALYVPHLTVTLANAGVPVSPVSYATIDNPDTNRGMVDIAGLLGGRPYFGDDIREVLSGLRANLAGSYVAGYEPSASELDNKFHRVKVTCERKGVKIETRARYYAYPDNRTPAARAQEKLLAAVKSPVDDPEIALAGAAQPAGKAAKVQVQISAADLLLQEQGGMYVSQVAIMMAGYTDKGPLGAPVPMDFTLRLNKEQYEAALKQGLPFGKEFPLDGGIKKVRFFIYDHVTGALGSLSMPVGGK